MTLKAQMFLLHLPIPIPPPQPSHRELHHGRPEMVSAIRYSLLGRGVLQNLFSHCFPRGLSNARYIDSSALADVFCHVETITSMDKSWWCEQGHSGWRWKQVRRGSTALQTALTAEAHNYTRCIFPFSSLLHSYGTLPKCFPCPPGNPACFFAGANSPFAFPPTQPLFLPWRGEGCVSSQRRGTTHMEVPVTMFELLHGRREENKLQLQWLNDFDTCAVKTGALQSCVITSTFSRLYLGGRKI